MIEDKELGLKVAEDPLEALWESTRIATELRIKSIEDTLIIEKALLEMCEDKLKELGDAGGCALVGGNK